MVEHVIKTVMDGTLYLPNDNPEMVAIFRMILDVTKRERREEERRNLKGKAQEDEADAKVRADTSKDANEFKKSRPKEDCLMVEQVYLKLSDTLEEGKALYLDEERNVYAMF